jgi:UDP-N-acetylmuramoyl-tripeptide--D-alanyl-D-alanine ligase
MTIEQLHTVFLESSGICTDSRQVFKNCLYVSLTGENFDGNTFAHQALEKGAYKAIISNIKYHKNTGETIIFGHPLEALQKLATFHRKFLNIPIIALTGSNGKTTTKELINAVLSQKYKTTATKGNLNNHIGVPLTLLSMTQDTEIGIVEMGANHPGEIAQLCNIARPDYGYITNFGKAHLEGFGSIEGVIKAKTELYDFLKSNNKTAFVNTADPIQVGQTKNIHTIAFGTDTIKLLDASNNLKIGYKNLEIQSNLLGKYNFNNIAAAIAIGEFFKVSPEAIKKGIVSYIPTNNRSQIIHKGTNKIILDAYNANPTSMEAAIENFKGLPEKNKILILGDMFELGTEAQTEHQHITSLIDAYKLGETYLIGENFNNTKSQATHVKRFKTFDDFKNYFIKNKPSESILLIKGSRGMALERVLDLF